MQPENGLSAAYDLTQVTVIIRVPVPSRPHTTLCCCCLLFDAICRLPHARWLRKQLVTDAAESPTASGHSDLLAHEPLLPDGPSSDPAAGPGAPADVHATQSQAG